MRAIGIKAFKNKLSEYVKLASGGEIVLVTDRDRVVAELGPPLPGRAKTVDDARLADLVRRGILTPPLLVSSAPPPTLTKMPLAEILRGLEEDRSDRSDHSDRSKKSGA
jgi:antitoxin (DNA-binding transcriptional repressor) of toxin-antitoxin stability system